MKIGPATKNWAIAALLLLIIVVLWLSGYKDIHSHDFAHP